MATRVSGLGFELQLQHLATAFFVVAGFALCLSSLCVVASSAVKTRQLGEAVSDLAPILILLTSSFMWSDECHVSVGITLKLLVASLSLLSRLPKATANTAVVPCLGRDVKATSGAPGGVDRSGGGRVYHWRPVNLDLCRLAPDHHTLGHQHVHDHSENGGLTLRDGRVIHVSLFRVFSHVKVSYACQF